MNKQVKQIRDEVERLQRWSIDTFTHHGGISTAVVHVLTDLLDFIDSIEEPEVDLEKEIDKIWNPRFNLGWDERSLLSMNHEGFTTIAKYFYELGLKTKENKL